MFDFPSYADIAASITARDTEMMLLGAALFAVPQFVIAAVWLCVKSLLDQD